MGAYLLRHTPAVIRLKSCRRKRRQAARESKEIQGVGGRRYTGEKTGWIGEEWPVGGVPLAPEVSGMDGATAVKHVGRHDRAMLGESPRTINRATVAAGTGRKLRPVQIILLGINRLLT